MISKPFVLPLFFAVVILSCNTSQPTKSSVATDLTQSVWITSDYVELAADEEDITIPPYTYLRLFKDSSFSGVALRGYFSGKWSRKKDGGQLWLMPDSNFIPLIREQVVVVGLDKIIETEMAWSLMKKNNDAFSYPFATLDVKQGTANQQIDPFAPAYNLYRQKPEKSENPEEIKKRVMNYLNFLEAFYLFSSENKLTKPESDWFPTPLKMEMTGSIRLANSEELKDWYACFYNEEQAVEGYKLISGAFLPLKLKSNSDIHLRNAAFVTQIKAGIK
jgi:hypothetical protein